MVDPTVAALRMRPTGVARRGPLLANPLNLFAIVLIALFALGAGYAGGLVNEALMRFTEIFLAFPPLILAMAIAGALGPSLTNAIIAIAAVTWAVYARLVRGQLLSLRRREYVEAARSIGASGP